ncbi:hypothetical protein SDJN02_06725, partial [Cucurbita argyrosperma subsp. argyrosperma]
MEFFAPRNQDIEFEVLVNNFEGSIGFEMLVSFITDIKRSYRECKHARELPLKRFYGVFDYAMILLNERKVKTHKLSFIDRHVTINRATSME